ncbi:MAG: HAD-IB family hydrolase [Pseudomonadales bacterium]|nr:HAD family hydrolase [Pseudomonadales bacterium]NIX08022.1 HAD-IB family hydrolase [Pseudomonadales bacterium]
MIARRSRNRPNSLDVLEFGDYVDVLEASGEREDVVAFFDLDRTIIAGYSITALMLERVRSGMSARHLVAQVSHFIAYGFGRAGYQELLESTVAELVGMPEQELVELGERAYERRLQRLIYPEARRLIGAHQELGHEVVMVTSATRYQAQPVARELGVDQICCTELEICEGRITGQVSPCFGATKRAAAIRLGSDRACDLDDAYFYTDSCDDLPLLEAVGRPVAANPKASLSEVATSRGWPQLAFRRQGEPGFAAA